MGIFKFNGIDYRISDTAVLSVSVRYMGADWEVPQAISSLFNVEYNEKSPYHIYHLTPKVTTRLRQVFGQRQFDIIPAVVEDGVVIQKSVRVTYMTYMTKKHCGVKDGRQIWRAAIMRVCQPDNAAAYFEWIVDKSFTAPARTVIPALENLAAALPDITVAEAAGALNALEQEAKETVVRRRGAGTKRKTKAEKEAEAAAKAELVNREFDLAVV